jgi:hypothetical protein
MKRFRKWYMLTLALMAAFVVANYKRIQWRVYLPCLTVASITGWTWCVLMERFDAWVFPVHSILGIKIGSLVLEDWIFSPVCFSFFYIVYRNIPRVGAKDSHFTLIALLPSVLAYTFYTVQGELAGMSLAAIMAAPAICVLLLMRHEIYVWHFIAVTIVLTIFSGVWDYAGVYFDWWQYAHDKHLYSTYAWVGNNPLEITPWLGWSGSILSYALIAAGERLFTNGRR